ncbi:HdeA/HdeB family chaperone, partial [Neisseria gonorrhoeae]|uniref:HdeA/HdeB family chaperone n=1 Tax=Neisseria gonorrhoeae TaxID=485 RepID=UPI001C9965B3
SCLRSPQRFAYEVASGRAGLPAPVHFRSLPMEIAMKITASIMFAAALALSSAPASATVLDLSTMTCKQFVEGGDDTIKMVLVWMDGWY